MPLLARTATKLLRTVGGEQHASSDDHEEDARREVAVKAMTEEEINADPIDSDDEIPAQAPPLPSRTSQTSTSSEPAKKAGTVYTRGKTTKKSTRDTRIRIPKQGSYRDRQANKAGRGGEEEKENVVGIPTSSAEKRGVEDSIFGMEYSSSKRRKPASTATYSGNIHVAPSTTYVKPKKKTLGRDKGLNPYQQSWKPQVKEDDDDLDNIEMMDAELDEMMATLDAKAKLQEVKSVSQPPSSPAKRVRPNLLATLGAYKQPSSSPTDIETDASDMDKPITYHIMPANKALRDLRHNLELDVAALPIEDRDSICALCQEPVDPTHSAAFYRDRKRTVRNQTLFCKDHKRIAAQTEYTALGLPQIDWEGLPSRIRSYKPQLVKLLRNETKVESEYRKQHAAKLLTGKAAVLPSRRKDKKIEELEQKLFDTVDDTEESTGYYGPRGKRIMMEVIGAELVEHIGEAISTDPVVGRSGFAAFLQAVLVPELSILLAMEDFGGVSEGVAKEQIQKSGELGLLLHEDIDDEVARRSDEELSDNEDVEWVK